MQATLQWKMRVTPADKKLIAYAAKHFRCKQSQLVKALVRAAHKTITAEKKNQLSPA